MHTEESRRKISLANKGKVPWNKGRKQSEETKEKIRQGVLRRLAEKELLNPRPSPPPKSPPSRRRGEPIPSSTRSKISNTMKAKWANSTYAAERRSKRNALYEEAVKNATREDGTVDYERVNVIGMRGRKHSRETREKISQTLKSRWSNEDGFRDRMVTMMKMGNIARGNEDGKVPEETRRKISEKLKMRWREEEGFREKMMTSMATRKGIDSPRAEEHRKRISDAIKAKWADEGYRKRATEGMKRSLVERKRKGVVKEIGKKQKRARKRVKEEGEAKVEATVLEAKDEEVGVENVEMKKVVEETAERTQVVEEKVVEKKKKKKVIKAKIVEGATPDRAPDRTLHRTPDPTPTIDAVPEETPALLELDDIEPDPEELEDVPISELEDNPTSNHQPPDLANMSALKQERYSALSRDLWNLLYGDDDDDDDTDDDGNAYATTDHLRSLA